MKNVPITLDGKTAAWLRAYNVAMRSFLGQTPVELRFVGGRRPTREELHERCAMKIRCQRDVGG